MNGSALMLEPGQVSAVVNSIGTPEFPAALSLFAREVAQVDHCAAIWIGPETVSPKLFFTHGHMVPADDAKEVAQRYAERSHQDPNYRKAIGSSARQDGVLLPFVQERINDPSYVQYFYTEVGVVDKVSTVTTIQDYKILSNYYRLSTSSAYDNDDRAMLRQLLPLAANLVGAQFKASVLPALQNANDETGASSTQRGSKAEGLDVELLMGDMNAPFKSLSQRERQVCEGIVHGHSYDVLAASLEVSEATIVTYRRRAYTKLGVGSANELLRLVLSSLK